MSTTATTQVITARDFIFSQVKKFCEEHWKNIVKKCNWEDMQTLDQVIFQLNSELGLEWMIGENLNGHPIWERDHFIQKKFGSYDKEVIYIFKFGKTLIQQRYVTGEQYMKEKAEFNFVKKEMVNVKVEQYSVVLPEDMERLDSNPFYRTGGCPACDDLIPKNKTKENLDEVLRKHFGEKEMIHIQPLGTDSKLEMDYDRWVDGKVSITIGDMDERRLRIYHSDDAEKLDELLTILTGKSS